MRIREARPEDFGELGEVRVAAYLADGFLAPGSDYAPRLRTLGADGSGQVLVAVPEDDGEDGGRILGTAMLQYWPDGEVLSGPDEAEIRALAVAPDARGSGLGRALLAIVIERAERAGTRQLMLLTQPEMKAAHHLYEEAGFRRVPERDWSPVPGLMLLAYALVLPRRRPDPARRDGR